MASVRRPDLVASLGVFEPTVPFTDWWPDHDEMMQRSLDLKPMFKRWNEGVPRRTPEQRLADEISMTRDFSFVESPPFDIADVAVPCLVGGSVDLRPHGISSPPTRLSTLLDADVVMFRDAGHTVHRTHPREFADGFTRTRPSLLGTSAQLNGRAVSRPSRFRCRPGSREPRCRLAVQEPSFRRSLESDLP